MSAVQTSGKKPQAHTSDRSIAVVTVRGMSKGLQCIHASEHLTDGPSSLSYSPAPLPQGSVLLPHLQGH